MPLEARRSNAALRLLGFALISVNMKALIPTNFSVYADFALELAKHMGKKMPMEWHVVYVEKAPDDSMIDEQRVISKACADAGSVELEGKVEQLKKWSQDLPGTVIPYVGYGDVLNQLQAYIRKFNIDLVVMGTPGAFGAKNLFQGSLAEKVMRVAPTPVLSVKCDRSDLDFSNIILAGDFVNPVEQNLDVLKAIQAVYSSEIHLLNVITKKSFQTTRTLRKNMREFATINGLDNVHYHTYADASIEEGVAHFADDENIDLITIGTHGYTGIQFLLKGGTSEGIVNHLYKPVLTFKI